MAATKGRNVLRRRILELLSLGWSHREVARELGVSHQAVSYYTARGALRPCCPACGAVLLRVVLRSVAAFSDNRSQIEGGAFTRRTRSGGVVVREKGQ